MEIIAITMTSDTCELCTSTITCALCSNRVRVCKVCNVRKPLDEFYTKYMKDTCMDCIPEYNNCYFSNEKRCSNPAKCSATCYKCYESFCKFHMNHPHGVVKYTTPRFSRICSWATCGNTATNGTRCAHHSNRLLHPGL